MLGGTASVPSARKNGTRQSASLQTIAPPSSSSRGAMIHRLGTDHSSRANFSDKIDIVRERGGRAEPVAFLTLFVVPQTRDEVDKGQRWMWAARVLKCSDDR
jgi:hypothetical protein